MDDLREKYEALTIRRDEAKQRYLEAQANIAALKNREEELAKEAAVLGVNDIELLDEEIKVLEEEIKDELAQIEQELDRLDKPYNEDDYMCEEFTPQEAIDLDTLLTEGGQPQRRTDEI